jgi:hypothetical protein
MQTKKKKMKPKNKLYARFAPAARFEWPANAAAPLRATQENEFAQLKTRLLAEKLQRATAFEFVAPLRRAANEAAALAWATTFPSLIFPALFEEKTAAAVRQTERQARLYANRQLVAA